MHLFCIIRKTADIFTWGISVHRYIPQPIFLNGLFQCAHMSTSGIDLLIFTCHDSKVTFYLHPFASSLLTVLLQHLHIWLNCMVMIEWRWYNACYTCYLFIRHALQIYKLIKTITTLNCITCVYKYIIHDMWCILGSNLAITDWYDFVDILHIACQEDQVKRGSEERGEST